MQYAAWAGQVLQGDLGKSLRTDVPVTTLIGQKLPVTLQLAAMAMLFALLVGGIPMGIVAAVRKGKPVEMGANIAALSGMSIPNFWLGIILIMVVSVQWKLLPASAVSPAEDFWLSIKTMLMPALVPTAIAALMRLALGHAGSAVGRLRAHGPRQGVPARSVVLRHALRNALMPIVTLVTLLFRRAAGRRRADRAGLHHPGLRQAGGGCRVHARLRRGAGRGPVRGGGLHPDEPAGRHPVHPGQSRLRHAWRHFRKSAAAARSRAWGKFKRNHIAMLGLAIVLFFVALALLALVANDPFQTSFTTIRRRRRLWLGTDELGRDIFSRMVHGARARSWPAWCRC